MNEALLLYFRSLRKVVDQFINDSGFLQEITKLVVTTPNHLCSAEHPRDFDVYMKLCRCFSVGPMTSYPDRHARRSDHEPGLSRG